MNARRVAELHRQLAQLHGELADALVEGEAANDEPPPPPPEKKRRRAVAPLVVAPLSPPDDLTRARARDNLNRLGFRRP
jgi:hypothetical protein